MKKLIGSEIEGSEKIKQLVKNLVAEVQSQCQRIETTKDAEESLLSSHKELVERFGKFRGRPLYYPYIGSGAGKGPYVELTDGSVKLDLINGIGIHIMGHSHPEVMEAAIMGSLSDVIIQGNLQPNMEYGLMSQKLVELASPKSRLRHAWVTTSGSMANENALKACRQKLSPARKVIAFEAAFAGRTTMMAEITDNPGFKVGLPEYNEVLRLPFYNKKDPASIDKTLSALKRHIGENPKDICAFMFEPMQGEGGYNVAPREFFIPLFDECRKAGILIWADEVQTFCRTGQFFAFETLDFGDYIDVCTVAKTLQSGATLYTEETNPQPGLIAGTFSGCGSELRAGLEILNILENQGYMGPSGKIAKIHNEFVGMLNTLNETTCKGLLQEAGGLGLMVAVTPLDGSKEKQGELLKTLYKNGLMAFGCGRGPFRLRFLLPMIMTSQDIASAGKLIEKSILELA
ncbi:MAG: aminotransferase class III-fold pyridoxal phosphate-dependent enzyme [Bdellovibrionaceae bacterium]|nr:aminotransferase class III-fold pyridoxal phosphate-dependent enzyme [Bdellovibrionales bacterium]MCB9085527.1 aminotransferase class III-fold pyridoxal phosphate-dependent enzyme [Pseudobdellovibrionaceae bacterium]